MCKHTENGRLCVSCKIDKAIVDCEDIRQSLRYMLKAKSKRTKKSGKSKKINRELGNESK